ncbi:MAG: hypothetical protein L3K01_07015 [Thermoplasmata archaeon]|nr:hypothetical protein [Thermoplasmata archaeon]
MSSTMPLGNGPTAPPSPPRPTAFIVGAFAISTIIGVLVLAVGLNGGFPGVIPGSHVGTGVASPPRCEGQNRPGPYTFSFVAGLGGGFDYNGTHPGPCVSVWIGSPVTVEFSVAPDAGQNHSWVLVNASNASTALSTPAFPGAGLTGAARFAGLAPGTSMVFHFNVTAIGSYQYICEVTGHYDFGMHGWFNVTPSPVVPGGSATSPHGLSGTPVLGVRRA